ncbi:MAG: hypothetical protein ACYCZX_18550 [Rhodospirillaceae bacterium]
MKLFAKTLAVISLCVSSYYVADGQAAQAASAPAAAKERTGLVDADSKLLLVYANPGEGKEAAFEAYYDKHMHEIAALPNFVRVQRFKFSPRKGRPDSPFKYLFIWEFKGDQDESFARLQQWLKDGRIGSPGEGVVAKLDGQNFAADGAGYLGTFGK